MELLLSYLAPLGVRSEPELITAISYTMLASGLSAFVALHFTVAPYGKYNEGKGKTAWFWGPDVEARAAWALQECPSFLVAAYCWWAGATSPSSPAARREVLTSINPVTVLLSLYLFHYFNRSFVYPLRIRGGKPTPLVIMLMAAAFCLCNGYIQGQYLAQIADASGSILAPRFVAGVLVWCAGLQINWQADDILRSLRRPGESGYKIPYGGAFQFVSGANFFGEIVEWAGFALAASSLPSFAFASFTFLNIGPRGASHHRWLLEKFRDTYPKDRMAVIPFLW